jgi:acyl-CoA thioester hydrolase
MHVKPCETRGVHGYTFSTTVRVRFADTDAQGIAHNTAYLVWFEVARVEYLREHAGGYQALRDHGVEALVLESHCRYAVPARFDDVLHVHARCGELRGARFRYDYAIVRDDGTLIAEGHTLHACVNADTLAPTRVPDWLRDAIGRAESSASSTSSARSSSSASSTSSSESSASSSLS